MIDHSIDERLHKLAEEFRKFVNDEQPVIKVPETTPKELSVKFGLTLKEAKAWLKNDPDFSSDVSYHEPQNRREVNGTLFSTHSSTCHKCHHFHLLFQTSLGSAQPSELTSDNTYALSYLKP